jgi:hypothetical protein
MDEAKYRERLRRYHKTKKFRDSQERYKSSAKGIATIRAWKERRSAKSPKRPKMSLDEIRAYRNEYRKRLRIENVGWKIGRNLSRRLREGLHGGLKSGRATELLGCSIPDFKIYLESLRESGMTWENYGKEWHIDHIMPCSIFDLSQASHQKRCFHFSNLQPLWAVENIRKNNKVLSNQFNLL